jgi:signal transduction histidine kinase
VAGRARLALWPALAIGGVVAEAAGFGLAHPGDWVPDLLTGWTLGGCGLLAWAWRPASLTGPLLVATSGLWFVGDVSSAAVFAYRGPLLQMTLCYPGGRPSGRAHTAAVAGCYAAAAIPAVWRSEVATIVIAVLITAEAAVHRRAAVSRERRERTYALGATGVLAVILAATAIARRVFETQAAADASLLVFEAVLIVLTVTLLAWLQREPWAKARATDLVVELGETRSGTLRTQLARTLGDPTLELGFAAGQGEGWVDAAGHAVALPAAGTPRRSTIVERDGRGLAVLVHDAAVIEDPGLAAALVEAAELAGSNARLQADVRAQIAELQASRRRLLVAGDDERRRLEQRLHETAERRLERLLPELEAARHATAGVDDERAARLQRIGGQLEQSLADLRRLAAGLHPRELATGGLEGAIRALAGRSPVPVDLELAAPTALSPELERAMYYVCSEGLANVAKYARATRARVAIGPAGSRLRIEVADDGCGGADLRRGSGLRGLADRVETLGGELDVESPRGAGTRLVAELPITGSS